jgi:CubicO group peptidase (beta-lactamase class C family)
MTRHRPSRGRRLASVALAALMTAAAAAPAAAQASRAETVRALDAIARAPVADGRVAGLAVAVVRGADTLLLRSYGRADLEWEVPLPEDAVFEIGSVTKQVTAVAILRLRDEGKLDLDADLTRYLPDYPTRGHRVPVRRLLDHTSGIRSYTEMASFGEISTRRLPRDSLVARFAAEPFDFTPGSAAIYNNSAYFLLGLIVERLSGESYEEYVERRLFEPLGMRRSGYCSNTRVVPGRARGYERTAEGMARASYMDHTWPYAAGSLCSTTGDLVTWLRALHGGRLLSAASYRELITPGRLEDGTPLRYAMGLARTPDPRGRAAIHHGGGIPGFLSDTRYYPDEDLYVVVLVNTTGGVSPSAVATELVDVLLPRPPARARAFRGEAAPLLGTYRGPARGQPMTVRVTAADGGLAMAVNGGPPTPLNWTEGWTFSLGGQIVTFDREGGGRGPATRVRLDSGGGHYVLLRQPG